MILGKNFWKEIRVVDKCLRYNTRIDEIIKDIGPPENKTLENGDVWRKKWGEVLEALVLFAKEIQLPTYHLYSKETGESGDQVKELLREIREYAQTRFGQLIGLAVIGLAFLSMVVSIVALIISIL